MEIAAKTTSMFMLFLLIFVAGGILLVGAVLKWTGVFPNCEISELCTVSGTFVALFTTIDVNIALDKFRKPAND